MDKLNTAPEKNNSREGNTIKASENGSHDLENYRITAAVVIVIKYNAL